MTIQELVQKLRDIAEWSLDDVERAHRQADSLLLDFINDDEVTDAFNEIEKWYS